MKWLSSPRFTNDVDPLVVVQHDGQRRRLAEDANELTFFRARARLGRSTQPI
jgi:hypothetical protein